MKNGFHFEDQPQISEFLRQLPYELTAAQLRVWDDMQKDMKSQYVMSRLVQGMLDQVKQSWQFLDYCLQD